MNKTQRSLGQRLLLRTAVSAILFIILIIFSLFYLVSEVDEQEASQNEILEIDDNLTDLYIAVIDQETGQRGFNLTHNHEYLEPFYNGIITFKSKETLLREQIRDFPNLKSHVLDTIEVGEKWTNQYGLPQVQIGLVGQKVDKIALKDGKTVFDSFRESFKHAHTLVEKESHKAQQTFLNKVISIIIGSSLIYIISFSILWYDIFKKFNSITQPIIELSKCVQDYSSNIFTKEPPKYLKDDEIAVLISNTNLMRIELEKNRLYLSDLADRDGLTGVYNRRYFNQRLEEEWKRQLDTSKKLNLILFDIDYFKRYNDIYGHVGGDECLMQMANTFLHFFEQSSDVLARYGGEEFVIISLEQDTDKMINKAEELRIAVENIKIPHIGSEISRFVTISVGVASIVPTDTLEIKYFIDQADKALYKSKVNGRNRVSSIQLQT